MDRQPLDERVRRSKIFCFAYGEDRYTSPRYDSARAMRETTHSATREGADVAVGRVEAQGQGIIGTAIPVAEHAVAR